MEIGVAIAVLLVVPISIAMIRVGTRRERRDHRRIPLRPHESRPHWIGMIAATGTRMPRSMPAAPRVARGSVAPPVRAATVRDVTADEFEDDPPTLVTLRPIR